eukprot:gene4075-14170_t
MEARRMTSAALLLLLVSGISQLVFAQDTIPIIPTGNVCAAVLPDLQTTDACTTSDQFVTALYFWLPEWDELPCSPSDIVEPVDVSANGIPLPFPLSDMRPVPLRIPSRRWKSEGANYYWMYRTVRNFAGYAPCVLQPDNSVQHPVPQGWDLVHTVIIPEPKDNNPDNLDDPDNVFLIPFASVITRDDMMVILVRGTLTKYELTVASTAYFTDKDKIDPRLRGMGRCHEGFSMLALKVFDSLQPILDQQLGFHRKKEQHGRVLHEKEQKGSKHHEKEQEGSKHHEMEQKGSKHHEMEHTECDDHKKEQQGRIRHVAVSGHSLGAGVSTILSYLVQQYINENTPGLNRIKVDAFLFAAPNAGNQEFNKKLAQKVNIRSIVFNNDVIHQVPCVPKAAACPGGQTVPFYIPNTEGNPPQLFWNFRKQRGEVNFGPGLMPYQSDTWQCFQQLDLRNTFGFLSASHICSYMCALSSFVDITENQCLLSSEGADLSVASFCPAFPFLFNSTCLPFLP